MPQSEPIKVSSLAVTTVIDWLGRQTIEWLAYTGNVIRFTYRSLLVSGAYLGRRRSSRHAVTSQVLFSGVDALATISILALAIGLTFTAQLILLLQGLTSEREVISLLNRLVAQEIAPLITAIVLIGRSGSAITVDLGNMKINREILGLEMLAVDIHEFFILPRILGVAISQFALAVYFAGIVMCAGIIFSALLDSPTNYKYLFLLDEVFSVYELLIFAAKNLIFGVLIGAIACFHGLRVERSVTELPQETQKGIVYSMVIIFVVDGLMVMLR